MTDGEGDINHEQGADARPGDVEDDELQCAFCGRLSSLRDAIEDGWTPDFWRTDTGTGDGGTTCPGCSEEHLDFLDGEYALKPGHEVFLFF